jgi:hypothetical protein
VTGVMMGGVPLTRISARILNSQGHGLSFTFSAAGELRWADPNNPSGIINVVG